jgi:two-component system, cell cycle sensor histidine kinase and response regulator CckA
MRKQRLTNPRQKAMIWVISPRNSKTRAHLDCLMEKTRRPSREDAQDDSQEIRLLETSDLSTETIEIKGLLDTDYTSSASFNFTWIEEAAFGKLLDAIPVPALLMGDDRNIVFANRAVGKIAPDYHDVVNSPFLSIFPDSKEAARAQELIDSILVDRKPKYLEGVLTILRNRIWGKMHLRSIRVSEQRLILILVEDLTAEKRRAVLNEKYRKLVHLLPVGIAEFSLLQPVLRESDEADALHAVLQAQLIDGNDEFAGIHRTSQVDELIGVRLESLFPCGPRNRDLYRKWIRGGYGITSAEFDGDMADGKRGYMECTLIGIVRKSRLYGLWFLKRDITESQRMKEDSFRAQKLESLGILAGGIAHDFNNSLTAILGNINLAKLRASSQEPVLQRLVEAERACGRAKCLTDQLLTFAKGGRPVKKVGSIASLLKESVEFALTGTSIAFDYSVPQELWPVEFDEGQMSQVMSNLAINAQQAMPDGGVLTVTAENVTVAAGHPTAPSEGPYVRISISDRGQGIPPENLSRIFDPYFTTKKKGSGLGLATSYAIMRGHGGSIDVESEVDVGSTFHLFLPASEKCLCAVADSGDTLCSGKGRILVMEDEPMVRDVAHEMLALIGYEVDSVCDGCQAIRAYTDAMTEGRPFAAVIMNLTVPGGMGGKDAMAELIRIDPRIRAIVSSGYPNDPVMEGCDGYGFKGVVSKPYNIEELNAILHKVISATDS